MIRPETLIGSARRHRFELFSGVPCSLLSPLLHELAAVPELRAIGAANEGDAVAICAGAAVTGVRALTYMQCSGLGNAVSPLTSLTSPMRIPLLLVIGLRGTPAHSDEPQHALMGRITPGLLDAMEIPHLTLPRDQGEAEAAFERAVQLMDAHGGPAAILVEPHTFAPARAPAAAGQWQAGAGPRATRAETAQRFHEPAADVAMPGRLRPSRRAALERVVAWTPPDEAVVVATTGHTSRELYGLADRPNHLYMVGSMGCAAALGLGLAATLPRAHVVVIDGDGAALMRLGILSTVGAHPQPNLTHVVLDNQMHASTGGQASSSATTSIAGVARACGYRSVTSGSSLDVLEDALADRTSRGPRLVHLEITGEPSLALPRPSLGPDALRERLSAHIRVMSWGPAAPARAAAVGG